jgi:hypothetical protein
VVSFAGEATGVSEVRFARVTSGGQRLTRRISKGNVQPTEASRTDVESGDLLGCEARKRSTQREPARRGCWYEDVKWQKSVRRIARRDARRAARQIDGVALAEEGFVRRADARDGDSEVRTVRVACGVFKPESKHDTATGVTPGPSRHDGRRLDHGRCNPQGRQWR